MEHLEPAHLTDATGHAPDGTGPSALPGPHHPRLDPVHARTLFLEGESVPPTEVRAPILTSWQRSRFWGVDADRIQAPYNADFDPHSRLATAARPVLDRLADALQDTPMALILTDSKGRVRERRTGDRALHRHLDDICLAPGFSYAEEYVGTNGIGTAAEDGRTAHVFGSEHFSERLQRVSCAAAPIRNPVSGRVVGLIDLTSWQRTASPLMTALVSEAAADIEERLLDIGSERERAAFRAFLTSRQHSRRALVTLTDGLLLADAAATELLGPDDHRRLRELAADPSGPREQRLLLSDGRTVQVRGRQVADTADGKDPAAYLIELRLVAEPDETVPRTPARPPRLPGIAGTSPALRGVVQQLVRHCEQGRWTLVDGEVGTGKHELVRAVHRHVAPGEPYAVHDAAEVRGGAADWLRAVFQNLAEDRGTVVLRHLDMLSATVAGQLDALLRSTAGRAGWVAALLTREGPALPGTGAPRRADDPVHALRARFGAQVTVPPLRHRTADIPALVAAVIARQGTDVTCTEGALRALSRAPWPGNVRQLVGSLRYAEAHRTGPLIEESDLPPSLLSQSQHPLSAWESTERDLIVQALLDHGGDKARAAKALGISRATIYRKIAAYGIRLGPETG
ncbi:sigma-54-dependent Fis family transcriptional regulator [Streptomyces sp. NBC_00588]|uniref:sigma-54-dependent Fis family transcriptional regulator n=1 Tax=Streptomyces sp. NBC_00588 TaxID=2975784 RepID=UPI002E804078|nr:helix-turn-helix domain-containing protein [Streptomyces sp. NBC_00588]WUB34204.1 Fis family transcriptional regulator [Streptomyces sp. NBC_00588]